MFRLITEWATLVDKPFNSKQLIALDAKEFLKQIQFDSLLVADQTNMQVAQYFLGDTDARRRPVNVVETNQGLLDFVKRKMAHMSLASLFSCYPEYNSINIETYFDIESAEKEFADDIAGLQINYIFSLDNYETALEFVPARFKNGFDYFALKWRVLKQKKDLALSLQNK
jgi:hypothetical protein